MAVKSKKEIKECIKKLKLLRTGIPHHDIFGGDNWKDIDIKIGVLEKCIEVCCDYDGIEDKLHDKLDEIDMEGGDCFDSPYVKAYDWILGNTDDELVSDDDIKIFCKNKKKKK